MTIKNIGIIVISILFILSLSWYLRNQFAKNIVKGVVSNPTLTLKSDGGLTNILLLGMGGDGHEGGELTDSILFASLNLESKKVKLITIPRDIWIPDLSAKVNTAYYYGNQNNANNGLTLAKSTLSDLLGVPVHYTVALDFQGFTKAIDTLGGIDVVIENTFDDYKYPISGKENVLPESDRYEHIHFDKGTMHMDGVTALKYVRSRHALGEEGTDFARGKRQSRVITAFLNKLLASSTLFDSTKLKLLQSNILSSIKSDIGQLEQGSFLKLVVGYGIKDNISTISITDYLVNPSNTTKYSGQWVLLPTPSLEELQNYVKTKLAE